MANKILTLPASLDQLDNANEFVITCAKHRDLDEITINKLLLVTEEIFVNIVNYAYGNSSGSVEIKCSYTGKDNFVLQFVDQGIAFNPLEVAIPQTQAPVEEREIGGLGIFLVKSLVESVEYQRENNHNILTITKRV
jgi:anti-sigma regulatory factor (Ser/Thr protein kinase)